MASACPGSAAGAAGPQWNEPPTFVEHMIWWPATVPVIPPNWRWRRSGGRWATKVVDSSVRPLSSTRVYWAFVTNVAVRLRSKAAVNSAVASGFGWGAERVPIRPPAITTTATTTPTAMPPSAARAVREGRDTGPKVASRPGALAAPPARARSPARPSRRRKRGDDGLGMAT